MQVNGEAVAAMCERAQRYFVSRASTTPAQGLGLLGHAFATHLLHTTRALPMQPPGVADAALDRALQELFVTILGAMQRGPGAVTSASASGPTGLAGSPQARWPADVALVDQAGPVASLPLGLATLFVHGVVAVAQHRVAACNAFPGPAVEVGLGGQRWVALVAGLPFARRWSGRPETAHRDY